MFGAIGLVVALAAGAFAYVTVNSHTVVTAPAPASAAPTTAAALPSAAPKPLAAAAAPAHPAAEPTARIVYVDKPAAAAPAPKTSVHAVAVEAAKPTAPIRLLRGLLTAAAGHFADVKGRQREVRGEPEYVLAGGVTG